MVVREELYGVFWTGVGAYSMQFLSCRYCLGVLAFLGEPELCLSVTDAVFPCALLSFLSFSVLCTLVCILKLTDRGG